MLLVFAAASLLRGWLHKCAASQRAAAVAATHTLMCHCFCCCFCLMPCVVFSG